MAFNGIIIVWVEMDCAQAGRAPKNTGYIIFGTSLVALAYYMLRVSLFTGTRFFRFQQYPEKKEQPGNKEDIPTVTDVTLIAATEEPML